MVSYSSSDPCERCFSNVNSLDIISSSLTTASSFFISFEQEKRKTHYEKFSSLKYLLHFFVPVADNAFL